LLVEKESLEEWAITKSVLSPNGKALLLEKEAREECVIM
jgi:hypothetical protein